MCHGQNGGKSKVCRKHKPVNGSCDSTKRNGCIAGTANDTAVADNNTYYKWQCDGAHSGINSSTCQYNKPINGSCSTTQSQCTSGTYKDISDSPVYILWSCEGQYNGSTSFCYKTKTAFTAPSLHLHSPNHSPGTDATPTFRVTNIKSGLRLDLYQQINCSGSSIKNVTTTGSSHDFTLSTNLSEGTTHFSVKATDTSSQESACSSNIAYELDSTAPSAPTVTLQGAALSTDTTPTLHVSGLTLEYTLTIHQNSNCTGAALSTTQVTSTTEVVILNALTQGTYTFYAKAADPAGNTTCSTSHASYTLFTQAPSNPTLTVTSTSTSRQNVLSWGAISYAQTYEIQYARDNAGQPDTWIQLTDKFTQTKYTHRDVGVFTIHYRVFAKNLYGKSAASNTVKTNISAVKLKRLSVGDNRNCAIVTGGGVKCWGENFGGTTISNISVSNAKEVTVGYNYGCALLGNGTVKCWGPKSSSVFTVSISDAVQISAQTSKACALTTSGEVKCWTGTGSVSTVSNLNNVVQISSGYTHTCALLSDGKIKCWGSGSGGKLGNGSTSNKSSPTYVRTSSSDSSPLAGISMIAAGYEHTCALTTSGTVKCWGAGDHNGSAMLGHGGSSTTSPVDVHTSSSDSSALSNIIYITTAEGHTCAITNNGVAKCWGSSDKGKVTRTSNILTDVVELDADNMLYSQYHTCAVTSSREIKCWGRSADGNLGHRKESDQYTPDIVYTSSSKTTPLKVDQTWASYTCASGTCTLYAPSPSVTGSNATPSFAVSNISAGDTLTVYADKNCVTQKGTATVAQNTTQASATLSSLGSSGSYQLYFTITATNKHLGCLGPVSYSF